MSCQICPGLAAFWRERFGAGVLAWCSGDGVSAQKHRRAKPVQRLFAGAGRKTGHGTRFGLDVFVRCPSSAERQGRFAPGAAPPDFAPALIAANPLKPCGRGVFQGLFQSLFVPLFSKQTACLGRAARLPGRLCTESVDNSVEKPVRMLRRACKTRVFARCLPKRQFLLTLLNQILARLSPLEGDDGQGAIEKAH